MRIEQLREIVRKIVKDEVHQEVQKQLPRLLFEMIGTTKSTSTVQERYDNEDIDEPVSIKEDIQQKPNNTNRFAKDPVLNQILSETAASKPAHAMYGNSMAELLDGGIEKIGGSEGIQLVQENFTDTPASPPPGSVDISKIFKAPRKLGDILKKSREKGLGGGMINSSNILQQW